MNNKKGITLIELLIGITLSAAIFVVATSLIASIFTTDTKGRNLQAIAQVKDNIQAELSESVRWGNVILVSPNELTVDSSIYNLRQGRIYKDNNPLTPESVEIKSFTINDLSANSQYKSLQINVELAYKATVDQTDSFAVVVSQRRTQINE
jgi:hypothetical protein